MDQSPDMQIPIGINLPCVLILVSHKLHAPQLIGSRMAFTEWIQVLSAGSRVHVVIQEL